MAMLNNQRVYMQGSRGLSVEPDAERTKSKLVGIFSCTSCNVYPVILLNLPAQMDFLDLAYNRHT